MNGLMIDTKYAGGRAELRIIKSARDPAQHLLHVPYTRAAGVRYAGPLASGGISLSQPFRAAVADPATGAIDQRAIAAFLDHACGVAVYLTLPEAMPTATLDLRVAFPQAPAAGEDVLCEAAIVFADAALAVVNATVRGAQSGRLLASGSGCFIVGAHPGQGPGKKLADPWHSTSPEIVLAAVADVADFASFSQLLGLKKLLAPSGGAVEIAFEPHLVGAVSLPALHGGVTAAALASAAQACMAALPGIGMSGKPDARLASISIQYQRAGQAKTLTARARIDKQGGRTSNLSVHATQDDGARVVATAQCVFLT